MKDSIFSHSKLQVFSWFLICSVFNSYEAYANGALPLSAGGNNTGLAGAGIAEPLEVTGNNINPALVVRLKNQISIFPGVGHLNQKVDTSHTHLTEGTPLPPQGEALRNRAEFTPVVLAGATYHMQSDFSLGISLSGGGGRTRYNSSPVSPAIKTGSKYESAVMLVPISVSWRPVPKQSYGLSLIIGRAGLKTNLNLPNGEASQGRNKSDAVYGVGGRIGGLWDLISFLSVGVTFTTPIYFQKYHKYRDLVKNRFVVPMRAGLGTSWHLTPCTDLVVDVEGYFWKQSRGTGNSPAKGGLGWKNTFAIMTGINHSINADWILRLGYSYNKIPIPQDNVVFSSFSPALALIKNSIATGVSYKVSQPLSLNINAIYGLKNKITDNGKGVLNGMAKNTTLSAEAIVVMIGVNYLY